MPEQTRRYWELVEPLFESVNLDDVVSFFASIQDIDRPVLLLFAAHFCLSEIHNGGFLQFFWNSTGILAPEAIEGFLAIGMPELASVVTEAAAPLGNPYPRDRDERWDILLQASGQSEQNLEQIFKTASNFYSGFVEATLPLNFTALDKRAWKLAQTENSDFGNAATRYAYGLGLFP